MRKLILAAMLMVAVAGQAWAINPEAITKNYINAQKKRDYTQLYYMDYFEGLVRRSFGSKSFKTGKDHLLDERLPAFKQDKAFPEFFPASVQYRITDVRKNVADYNYYEKYKKWTVYTVLFEVSYPNKTESPESGGNLVKKSVMGLSIDGKSGNIIEASVKNAKVLEVYGLSPNEIKRQRDEQAAQAEQERQKKADEEKALNAKRERELAEQRKAEEEKELARQKQHQIMAMYQQAKSRLVGEYVKEGWKGNKEFAYKQTVVIRESNGTFGLSVSTSSGFFPICKLSTDNARIEHVTVNEENMSSNKFELFFEDSANDCFVRIEAEPKEKEANRVSMSYRGSCKKYCNTLFKPKSVALKNVMPTSDYNVMEEVSFKAKQAQKKAEQEKNSWK